MLLLGIGVNLVARGETIGGGDLVKLTSKFKRQRVISEVHEWGVRR